MFIVKLYRDGFDYVNVFFTHSFVVRQMDDDAKELRIYREHGYGSDLPLYLTHGLPPVSSFRIGPSFKDGEEEKYGEMQVFECAAIFNINGVMVHEVKPKGCSL